LEPLVPNWDYARWYREVTGHRPNTNDFGIYAIAPLSGALYLGFGTGLPADRDGALLARYQGSRVAAVYPLSEQGVMDMVVSADTLYIAGVDPCCPDGWAWGNTYVLDPPAPVTKHRNLPRVIHTWGLWFDEQDAALYAAVSGQERNPKRWTGGVYRSTDRAETWNRLAGRDDGVGLYRTYDVMGHRGRLYVTWNDALGEACGLAVSHDGGSTWSRFLDHQTRCSPRLVAFKDKLLALESDRSGLITIKPPTRTTPLAFPGFRVPAAAYNYAAIDRRGYLCAITDDGRVVRSADLTTWETLVTAHLDFMTIAFWPEKNWLIVADRGAGARLWRIDLAGKRFHHIPEAADRAPTRVVVRAVVNR
jgi:hypothetical protein